MLVGVLFLFGIWIAIALGSIVAIGIMMRDD